MKAFFEEYGFVLLAAVVVVALIGISANVGDGIEDSITGIVDAFETKITTNITNA